MKQIFLASLLWLTTYACSLAQVKGNTYYDIEGTLGDNINVEILVEINKQGDLAMGEINYHRKNGSISSIRLYGQLMSEDTETGQKNYFFFEHLPGGKITGAMALMIQNGRVINGGWSTPDQSRKYEFNIQRTKPFPYSKWDTFFAPAEKKDLAGVYRNCMKPDDGEMTLEMVINEVAKCQQEYVIPQEHQLGIINNGVVETGHYLTFDQDCRYHEEEENTRIDLICYRDFIFFKTETQGEQDPIGLFFIKQEGEKIVPMASYTDGMYARLKNGTVTVSFNRELATASYGGNFEDDSMCPNGSDLPLWDVANNVEDIYCTHIGEEPHPILGLLLVDGRVQLFSPFETVGHGGLTVSQPYWDLKYITGFAEDFIEIEDGPYGKYCSTLYAVDYLGERTPLLVGRHSGDWEHVRHRGNIRLSDGFTFDEEWHIHYGHHDETDDASHGNNWYGSYRPLNEEEAKDYKDSDNVYRYVFTQTNDSRDNYHNVDCHIEGIVRIESYYDTKEECKTVKVTPLEGEMTFGAKQLGETVVYKFIFVVG